MLYILAAINSTVNLVATVGRSKNSVRVLAVWIATIGRVRPSHLFGQFRNKFACQIFHFLCVIYPNLPRPSPISAVYRILALFGDLWHQRMRLLTSRFLIRHDVVHGGSPPHVVVVFTIASSP